MKQLGYFVFNLLLLSTVVLCGLANAGLTASQPPQLSGSVGETITLTARLTSTGDNALQATVTPELPSGVVSDMPYGQTVMLYPGISVPVNYPIRAEQGGIYNIATKIDYDERGMRILRLYSTFSVAAQTGVSPTTSPSSQQAINLYHSPILEIPAIGGSSDGILSGNST
ncbi:MAG: hypothetical protein MUO26_14430 [Methanotrichaceae archaeon]|nr:hypothetical protein [Methanotrichaceae archaeon]